jgi:PAS domain S-box-containing protein
MCESGPKPTIGIEENSSGTMLRSLLNGINDIILVLGFTDNGEVGPIVEINDVACSRLGYDREELLHMCTDDIILPEYLERQYDVNRSLAEAGRAVYESAYRSRDGRIIPVEVSAQRVELGGMPIVLSVARDITERKQSEEISKGHSYFMECLERIDQVIKRNTDVEQMLQELVETMFSIFDCDRAWLLYPCDPEAPSFRIHLEITRAEYPGAKVLNVDVPMSSAQAQNMREALESDGPVTYADGTDRPISTAKQFGVQSQMFTPVNPKLGKPWVLGMHQCSYPRIWTNEEKNLFMEIARRTADGLSSALHIRELRDNEERFRILVNTIPDLIWLKDADGVFLNCNKTFERYFGAKEADIVGKTDYDFVDKELADFFREHDRKAMAVGKPSSNEEWITFADDGQRALLYTTKIPMHDSKGRLIGVLGVGRDITDLKRAEQELRESRKQYLDLVEETPDLITRVDVEGRLLFVNHAALDIFGLAPEECIGRLAFDFIHPEDRETTIKAFQSWLKGSENFTHENRQVAIDGRMHHMTWAIHVEKDEAGNISGLAGAARDITDLKWAEEEKTKLESQLHQAQKMESVGSLAGGVAHDFNNMLGVILGHASLALLKLDPAYPLHGHLEQIRKAAERSAELTQQLLTFARKQTIAPKVLDLNDSVASMLKMLQRLIGERIQITWQPAADLWLIKIDPSQINQILTNLCVNARDSIGDIGIITIETGNSTIDVDYCANRMDVLPGDYVRLVVSDNGCGMDNETMQRIFEPFFTTKEMGKGTGLGLATVFGIVMQNNGCVNVYSEPGLGSTFTINLPRHVGNTWEVPKEGLDLPAPRGQETILLVEDEMAILDMASMILSEQGYTVLQANTPGEAIRLAKEHVGKIGLLITDVIMPEMNGKDLAHNLQSLHPQLKCLFMSGYTADAIARHGVLDDGVNFIQKPFSLTDLAFKVRELLDS